MAGRLLVPLVVGLSLGVISVADPQARYQLRSPLQFNAQTRNFVPNRFSPKKVGRYPPVPPGTGSQLPGDSRNFIPNRFDIPASIVDKKPGSSVGCVCASPCGLAAPYSPPALPIPPPAPVAYGGFPPAPVPYGPQGYAQPPPMGTDGFGMHSINSLAQSAAQAKAKLLGGIHPLKKFVPHIPPMGRPQRGKPPYNPPPPLPKPQGYSQAGQLPYQQPFGYGSQGMGPAQTPGFLPQPQGIVPPQTPGFAPQPAAGIPQPRVPPMQADFADPQAFTAPEPLPQQQTQQPSPLGPPQQDVPQTISNAPQFPFPQDMNQAPAYNDPSQPPAPDGSFDLAKKRMMALRFKAQAKKFGVPRPVLKSRLVPKPLFKRHI